MRRTLLGIAVILIMRGCARRGDRGGAHGADRLRRRLRWAAASTRPCPTPADEHTCRTPRAALRPRVVAGRHRHRLRRPRRRHPLGGCRWLQRARAGSAGILPRRMAARGEHRVVAGRHPARRRPGHQAVLDTPRLYLVTVADGSPDAAASWRRTTGLGEHGTDRRRSPSWPGHVRCRRVEPRSAAEQRSYSSPEWSPDASRIAFTRSVNGSYDVFVVDADGSNRTNLTRLAAGRLVPDLVPGRLHDHVVALEDLLQLRGPVHDAG